MAAARCRAVAVAEVVVVVLVVVDVVVLDVVVVVEPLFLLVGDVLPFVPWLCVGPPT